MNKDTIIDRYGKFLYVGCRVAFNKSGEVALGIIKEIKPTLRYGKARDYNGELYRIFYVREQGMNDISKVTNRKNLTSVED